MPNFLDDPNNRLWAAAATKELIGLGERIYTLTNDPKVQEEIIKLKDFIYGL